MQRTKKGTENLSPKFGDRLGPYSVFVGPILIEPGPSVSSHHSKREQGRQDEPGLPGWQGFLRGLSYL